MTSNDGAAREFQFTSESVTEGHPDKIADQISDVVLDAVLAEDPLGRVACETLITTGLVVVAGEISTHARLDVAKLVRERIRQIGYTRAKYGFDADTCGIMVTLDEQSQDIAQGVDASFEAQQRGAGDPLDSRRRGRPGNDVRLRGQRVGRAHAAADRARAPPRPPALRGAQGRDARLPPARRQDPGHACATTSTSTATARPSRSSACSISTQHREGVEAESHDQARPDRARHRADPAGRLRAPARRPRAWPAATSCT